MSLEYRDVSASAHPFRPHLKALASTRVWVLLSVVAAVCIAGVARGLISSTQGVRVSTAPTPMVASPDFALSSRPSARPTQGPRRAARRICEEALERGGPDALPAYSICVRKTLDVDSML